MKLTKEERMEMLAEAQEMILEATNLIEEAVSGTSVENSANAYIIPHLRNWAGEDSNPYDETINELMTSIIDEEN